VRKKSSVLAIFSEELFPTRFPAALVIQPV